MGNVEKGKSISEWILTHRWAKGKTADSIVCPDVPKLSLSDVYPETSSGHLDVPYYGGILVAESVTSSLRSHIIDLHNQSLIINP